jgi:hypothetical protein
MAHLLEKSCCARHRVARFGRIVFHGVQHHIARVASLAKGLLPDRVLDRWLIRTFGLERTASPTASE